MAIVVTPMMPASSMAYYPAPQGQYYMEPDQQAQYDHYRQAQIMQQYSAIPTPVSGHLPVQHVSTPVPPLSNPHPGNANDNRPWTAEMDQLLMDHRARFKWEQISIKVFHGTKSGNACRKRWARLMQEQKMPARWEQDRIKKVIAVYQRVGVRERMFKELANLSGEKWQDVERLCYNQGFKEMTGTMVSGHSRRQSRAVSHRSHASLDSNHSQNEVYDDDGSNDDSGLGGDVQVEQHLAQITVQGYVERQDTYHDSVPEYEPAENYYSNYRAC